MGWNRIVVIMNPAARSMRAGGLVDKVRALRPAAEIHLTEAVGHATELAESLATDGADVVVAAGGDGTVNEVLQGLCRANAKRPDPTTHTALGTLPAGTMNVFACELGFKSRRDFVSPWKAITAGKARQIDLWMANDRYFLQLAGVGADAEIVKSTTSALKNRFGPAAYGISALQVLGRPSPILEMEVPSGEKHYGALALLGNGKRYGGPFKVFTQADVSDGLLDVIVFRDASVGVLQFAELVRSVLIGNFACSEHLDYLRVPAITIRSSTQVAVEVDGELSGATPVVFRRADFPLRVASA
ncbi:MAG: diacylglycerol kinase family lipid kinase [Verrucomicrobiaceae bacterium]|nr:diacylglycerol kinase family lipid kinase [Verrucomicrobiaceae bacterium]